MKQSLAEKIVLVTGFVAATASGFFAWRTFGPYGEQNRIDPRVRRIAGRTPGHGDVVMFDSDGDLLFDTWSYMDGDRLVRMDIDDDQNGTIDQRQYFGPDGSLDRTEFLDATGRVLRTVSAVVGASKP